MEKRLSKNISSYLGYFLKVLTIPQRVHFLVYLVGLVWLIKFRSIREISSAFGTKTTDSLHHFLTETSQTVQKLSDTMKQTVFQHIRLTPAILILDDTPVKRNGKRIDGLGLHHSANGLVKGLCAVTSILKIGTQRLAWAIRGYRPKKTCLPQTFKSKVQLAIEILKETMTYFGQGTLTVLMDSWYTCAPVLRTIQEAGWVFMAALKQNRLVRINGKKRCVKHLAKGLKFVTVRLAKKKRFKVAKIVVDLPKVGLVVLFISQWRGKTRFFITNDRAMTEHEMVQLYGQRFWIETFHQEIKQHLGFGEMFMRSWTGVQTHWTLVGIAYNMIVLWNGKRKRTFRQMIRCFRESVSHKEISLLPNHFR